MTIVTSSFLSSEPDYSSKQSEFYFSDRYVLFTSSSLGTTFTSSMIFTDGCSALFIQAKVTNSISVPRPTGSIGIQISLDGIDWGNIRANNSEPSSFYQVSGSNIEGFENEGVAQWAFIPPVGDLRLVWEAATPGQDGSMTCKVKKIKF